VICEFGYSSRSRRNTAEYITISPICSLSPRPLRPISLPNYHAKPSSLQGKLSALFPLELTEYITNLFSPREDTFRLITEAAHAAGMPYGWEISPDVGKLFQMFCAIIGAKRVLEFGTFAGHSAIYFARAIPADGNVISIEIDPEYAAFARRQIENAGADRFDVIFLDTEEA